VYKGRLPVNTLIAPAKPTGIHPAGAFGWRIAPDIGGRELHNGADLPAPDRSPVVAAMDGVVRAVFWNVWGGNRVEVSHFGGLKTTYNHLSEVSVRQGDVLKASQRLGSVGMTGARVTGPHLHFETWADDKAVDPQTFDWIVDGRVLRAPRQPGQEVGKIPLGGRGDKSSLDRAEDCPHTEDNPIDCSAPDAVDEEERCSDAGGGGSDCPGGLATQRQECVTTVPGRLNCDLEETDPEPPGGSVTTEPPGGSVTTTPLPPPPVSECTPTEAGGLDCPPPGPGLEDCPAPANGRTDCPPPQTVPEGSSSSATGNEGGADLPGADTGVQPLAGPPIH